MAARWRDHRDDWGLEADVDNRTTEYAMIALQGPEAEELLAAETDPTWTTSRGSTWLTER